MIHGSQGYDNQDQSICKAAGARGEVFTWGAMVQQKQA